MIYFTEPELKELQNLVKAVESFWNINSMSYRNYSGQTYQSLREFPLKEYSTKMQTGLTQDELENWIIYLRDLIEGATSIEEAYSRAHGVWNEEIKLSMVQKLWSILFSKLRQNN